MPHSPRIYRDRLWLHNSGTGHFGSIDPGGGPFEPLTFCPGYLRGLAFVGDYAVVGLSRPRDDKTFGGLELADELARRSADARCGLLIIDLRTGDVAHWLRVEGIGARTLRCGGPARRVPADGAGFQDRRDPADDRHR